MQLLDPSQRSLKLVQSLIEFANQSDGRPTEQPFKWALQDSELAVRAAKLQSVRDAFRSRAPSKETPLKTWHAEIRRWLFVITTREALAKLIKDDSDVAGAVTRLNGLMQERLAPILRSVADVTVQTFRNGQLLSMPVPIVGTAEACAARAMSLLLADGDLLSRVHMCPYSKGGSFWDLQDGPLHQFLKADSILADADVHFFIDARFEKGTQMTYCKTAHRNAANQRKYRRNLAETK